MSFVQMLMMMLCWAIYVISLLMCLAICIGSPIWKFLAQRQLTQQSQQFPCGSCHYFSHEAALKCAVRPVEVMTEAAYHCQDFAARS